MKKAFLAMNTVTASTLQVGLSGSIITQQQDDQIETTKQYCSPECASADFETMLCGFQDNPLYLVMMATLVAVVPAANDAGLPELTQPVEKPKPATVKITKVLCIKSFTLPDGTKMDKDSLYDYAGKGDDGSYRVVINTTTNLTMTKAEFKEYFLPYSEHKVSKTLNQLKIEHLLSSGYVRSWGELVHTEGDVVQVINIKDLDTAHVYYCGELHQVSKLVW